MTNPNPWSSLHSVTLPLCLRPAAPFVRTLMDHVAPTSLTTLRRQQLKRQVARMAVTNSRRNILGQPQRSLEQCFLGVVVKIDVQLKKHTG